MKSYEENKGELTALLEQMITEHRQLLRLLEAEQNAIIAARPDELAAIGEQKAALTQTLRDLESRRIIHMGQLTSLLGQSGQDLSLKRLAAAVDPVTGRKLMAIRRQLHGLIAEIQRENRTNKDLLGDSLRFVRGALETLGQMNTAHSFYGQNGQVRGRGGGGQVIQGQI